MNEKVTTSFTLERGMKERVKRVSNILELTGGESQLICDALNFYFERSDIGKQALKKSISNQKYSEKVIQARKITGKSEIGRKNYSGQEILNEVSMRDRK